jgi:hypothetical protein
VIPVEVDKGVEVGGDEMVDHIPLPEWMDVDWSGEHVATVAIIEYLLEHQHAISRCQHRYDAPKHFERLIFDEVNEYLKTTTLNSPLDGRYENGLSATALRCFYYFDRCGGKNTSASKRRSSFRAKI